MNVKQIIIFFICILVNTSTFSQVCEIDSINYNHIDCYGESTGSISVKLLQPDSVYQKTYWWTGPDGFYANQTLNISNLKAGDYVKFASHTKVYMVVADVTADGSNEATLTIEPPLLTALTDDSVVTYDNVPFTVHLTNDMQEFGVAGADNNGNLLYQFELDVEETL